MWRTRSTSSGSAGLPPTEQGRPRHGWQVGFREFIAPRARRAGGLGVRRLSSLEIAGYRTMRLRPTPPAIPADLLDRFGEPEDVFGPNMRFRVASVLLGALLLLLGLGFFLSGVVARGAQAPPRGSEGVLLLLG